MSTTQSQHDILPLILAIVDTDPGVDDVIAMCVCFTVFSCTRILKALSISLLAIASPELEILAFNVSYGP